MDRSRLIMALALSLVVLMSWPLVMRYLAPQPIEEQFQVEEPHPQRATENPPQPSAIIAKKADSPAPKAALPPQAPAQTTQVGPREIKIISRGETDPYWHATLSNHGAVATSWILERYKEGGFERQIIGADGNELQLIPQAIPDVLSPPLSLRTPWSPEKI